MNNKEEKPEFPGSRSTFVHQLQFLQPDMIEGIPVYRVMNRKGQIIEESQDPKVWKVDTCTIIYLAQRLLRLIFFLLCTKIFVVDMH